MSTERVEKDHAATTVAVRRDTFRSYVQAFAAMFGGATYGLGWLFMAGVSSRLGIQPEEIGVSFAFLAVRTSVVLLAVIGIAVPIIYAAWNTPVIQAMWRRGPPSTSRSALGGFILALQVVVLATFLFIFLGWQPWNGSWVWLKLVLALGALSGFVFLEWAALVFTTMKWEERRGVMVLVGLLLGALFVSAGVWYSGWRVASDVKDGNNVNLLLVHFYHVTINPVPAAGPLPSLFVAHQTSTLTCYTYLGAANEVEVFLAREGNQSAVLRIAEQNILTVQRVPHQKCPTNTRVTTNP